MTEKLVDPMFAHSIPIYVGDPQAQLSFDPSSYIDVARFSDLKQMIEFVREVDNDRALYLKMLAAPYYRDNAIPDYARDATHACLLRPHLRRRARAALTVRLDVSLAYC